MNKLLTTLLVVALLATPAPANAKTKKPYGYTLKHASVIKCPYYSCHKSFRHK